MKFIIYVILWAVFTTILVILNQAINSTETQFETLVWVGLLINLLATCEEKGKERV